VRSGDFMEPGLEYEGCHVEDGLMKSVDMLERLQNLSLKRRRAFGYGAGQCRRDAAAFPMHSLGLCLLRITAALGVDEGWRRQRERMAAGTARQRSQTTRTELVSGMYLNPLRALGG